MPENLKRLPEEKIVILVVSFVCKAYICIRFYADTFITSQESCRSG